jgi:hypothetical protein
MPRDKGNPNQQQTTASARWFFSVMVGGVDDFGDLVRELEAGAAARNLRVLDAYFTGQPDVILLHETTAPDEVLDLAQQCFAPVLSLHITRLDLDHEVAAWEEWKDTRAPGQLRDGWRENNGQIDYVSLQWMVSGTHYLYMAVPAWKQALDALASEIQSLQDTEETAQAQSFRHRVTYLAEQLELDPEYRAGTIRERESIGKRVLEPLLRADEGAEMTRHVLQEAKKLVSANSQDAYAEISKDLDGFAAELKMHRSWSGARSAAERKTATRDFLRKRTGGYAPSVALIDEFKRRASK